MREGVNGGFRNKPDHLSTLTEWKPLLTFDDQPGDIVPVQVAQGAGVEFDFGRERVLQVLNADLGEMAENFPQVLCGLVAGRDCWRFHRKSPAPAKLTPAAATSALRAASAASS